MPLAKEIVHERILQAFHGVTLGNGVGIFEADAVDDYADDATRRAYREKDEKEDWKRIPLKNLREDVLCFGDAEGMRFHLPAFMIATLDYGGGCSWVSWLRGTRNPSERDNFVLLSDEQREALREFLLFIRDDPRFEPDRELIEAALSGPWKSDHSRS